MDTNQNENVNAPAGNVPQISGAKNTTMGVLAYLGPLVVISFLSAKEDPFVKFHIKQGLILLVVEVVVWMLSMFMDSLWTIFNLINLATLVLSIIGIVNVVNGKEKELPVVGKFSSYFKI